MSLFHADSYSPDDMVMHPRHQAMQSVLVQLIQQLRACETVEAGADFQRDLLTRLLEVEKDRWEFKRAVTRMRNGKQPHREVPELQSGRDPADIATWRFEHDVCERLARQLRSVGDALAWRVFGFHRPFILALCRNQSPGPMYGKAGLPAELEHFERACKEDGAFALLHDLTNCLRIGDMTVWDSVNPPRTEEIKTNPKNTKSAAPPGASFLMASYGLDRGGVVDRDVVVVHEGQPAVAHRPSTASSTAGATPSNAASAS